MSETNREEIRISQETVYAETPVAPAMDVMKVTSEDILGTKQTVNTTTIRSDGNRDGIKRVGEGGEGSINLELIFDMYNKPFEGTFRNTFTTISTTEITIAADAASQQFQDSANGFTALNGYKVGVWVLVGGFAAAECNGFFRITEVDGAGAFITVANGATALVDELAGLSISITGNYIRNNVINQSYLIEKGFLDVGTFTLFPGIVFGGLTQTVTALEILEGSFTTMAQQGIPTSSTASGSLVPANENQQMTASYNVSDIYINNILAANLCIQSLSVTVDNGLRPRPCVASPFSDDYGRGEFGVDGTLNYYYEDNTLEDYKKAHTEISLSWRATDIDGNVMIFTVPAAYLNEGGPDSSAGGNNDIIPSMAWAANKATIGAETFTMQLDSIAV